MPRRKLLPIYPLPGEVHAAIAACDNERDRLLLELLWHTGGRVSEVLAIRVGDLTPTGVRMINLKQKEPAEKHVFLHPAFRARLAELCKGRSPGEYLIVNPRTGKPISRQMAWLIVKRACARAGVVRARPGERELEPLWPHAFRHGFAVNLLQQHVPVTGVQQLLGHGDLGSTQIYAALANPDLERHVAGVRF